jgi:sugar phosphate isomerase/epimerase
LKIGLVTDSLGHLSLDAMLSSASSLGIAMVEFGCGNWSSAPHLDLDGLLASAGARRTLLRKLADHGLEISALNCSGNPLHPGASGVAHAEVTAKTIRLAGLLEVTRVVAMSGCPGGPGDANANWITTAWPPKTAMVLKWQWEEAIVPYWRAVATLAGAAGVTRLALELHGQQAVYNVGSLRRLRAAVGPVIGANFDPSHLFWMGADPLVAIAALGPAIHHVHAKDTRIIAENAAVNSLIDTTPMADLAARSWAYVTLGHGHDAAWWQRFCAALLAADYDDVLSIEHEDVALTAEDGVAQSVGLLRDVMVAGRGMELRSNPA